MTHDSSNPIAIELQPTYQRLEMTSFQLLAETKPDDLPQIALQFLVNSVRLPEILAEEPSRLQGSWY